MKKLSVSKLIDFFRRSEKSKSTFLKQHNKPKEPAGTGGDYWVSCSSAISNAFRSNNNSFITEKIEYLQAEIKKSPYVNTKNRYQRNINILNNFLTFNFSKWIDINELTFLNKNSEFSVIHIKEIPIQVTPNHIFTFDENGDTKIGAVYFVTKLDGYTLNELAAFADAIYRYLKINYSKKFKIEESLCLAVDTFNLNEISYEDIKKRNVMSILDNTISQIKKVA